MAAHLRPLAPSSTDVERNLIASPSPTQAISKLLVSSRRRITPLASALELIDVFCEVWKGRVMEVVAVKRFVFMTKNLVK